MSSFSGLRDASIAQVAAGRGGFGGVIGVVLVALAGYAVTLDQRAYYGDDYALRAMVLAHGWLGGYRYYLAHWGFFRPLGVLNILAWHKWLWAWPVAQQTLMLSLHVLVCLLLYRLVREMTGAPSVGVAAAAVFAAWHSYTPAVAWVSYGAEALPAAVLLLTSLLLYHRHVDRGAAARTRRYRALSLLCFSASVLFHDQHLGTAALFSALALTNAPPTARFRRVLTTWPFWAVAAAVGVLSMVTTLGMNRSLEPSVTNLLTGLPTLAATFWRTTVWQSLGQWVLGTGAVAALRLFRETDPQRLASALIVLSVGCTLIWRCRRHASSPCGSVRGTIQLALIGSLLGFVTIALMASAPQPVLLPRHTLWPAMGLAMLLAAGFGLLCGRWTQPLASLTLVALLFGLTLSRLGSTYEWTLRTRVTDRVLQALAALAPEPAPGQLLVIDGVRKYGRGFTCAWGLSSAVSLDRGVPVHVTTLVRRQDGKLVANAPGQMAWPVDPASARFFVWDEQNTWLTPSSLAAYLRDHPAIDGGPGTSLVSVIAPTNP